MYVEDGTGGGYKQRVGSDNRAQVRSVNEEEVIHFGETGNAYNWNTGLITGIAGNSTLIYLKNNETDDLIISDIAIAAFDGITHSDSPYITIVRNPTGGDLISDATAIGANQNRNFGSSNVADIDVYKGKNGGTLTGGNDLAYLLTSKTGRSFFTINLMLPKGSSIGVKLTANASSGSASYYAALIGYFKDGLDV